MLQASLTPDLVEAGCDEAGRGCIAGPVYAAAVILPKGYQNPNLDDSKKLSRKDRNELRSSIEKDAIEWAVASLDNHQIDKVNILNASIKSMHLALDQLTTRPELILVDGNRFHPYEDIQWECIIKGDGKYQSIAAASILAKTYRDDYMEKLHGEFPDYDWQSNKGYPTEHHRSKVIEVGVTPYHRLSFQLKPLPEQGSLF
jgi:ribonuclease HII